MNKKSSFTIFLLVFIEGVFLIRFQKSSLEMFFMLWGMLFIGIFLYSLFPLDSKFSVDDRATYSGLALGEFDKSGGVSNPIKPIEKSTIVIYMFMIVLNLIGYIWVLR